MAANSGSGGALTYARLSRATSAVNCSTAPGPIPVIAPAVTVTGRLKDATGRMPQRPGNIRARIPVPSGQYLPRRLLALAAGRGLDLVTGLDQCAVGMASLIRPFPEIRRNVLPPGFHVRHSAAAVADQRR